MVGLFTDLGDFVINSTIFAILRDFIIFQTLTITALPRSKIIINFKRV
ncbi:hypothetical protein NARC_30218 [Candidatus Nitrosocosmicus arcticus]|uniref:Uncharacterized protein n=1 Tax=Candidatus Nitrosocosmicus arcticus TaxID=2035267 RepID=A0A557SY36_9ARCH|nr:hypothetical protein NARC_30218 [Candidatus Nitrosocosmicus arcticus]